MSNEDEVQPEESTLPVEEVAPEIDVAPVVPPPAVVEPVVQPIIAPKPPAAPKNVRTRPVMATPIVPVLAGSVPVMGVSATRPQVTAISGPQRLVVDVKRQAADQLFQGLKIEAKFIDGLPSIVISKGGGHKPITVMSPERPQHRFVIEY